MAAKPQTVYLYVIGTSDGPTKVGHSLAPKRRLEAFQREGHAAVLAGTWPINKSVALAAERYVHWQLRQHHIRGEWFDATRPKVLGAIRKALSRVSEFDGRHPIPSLDRHGPKIRFAEKMRATLHPGTFDRIMAVLLEDEDRTDFVREAVERELKRRERKG